ncbi:MAG: acetylglutamate kinase [Candidatus Omnitrophota bacterium]|nr:acetylglutamate kinase [Candidatus Omnitrophota bacterium]
MEKIIEKADVLIEALPYIKTFKQKVVVIKFGGSMLLNDDVRTGILQDMVFLSFVGIRPVLVHGGGPIINQRMKASGIQPQFVDGLRVTNKKSVPIAIEALSDLNKQIVKEIRQLGGETKGLDETRKILKVKRHGLFKTIGYVGEISLVDKRPIIKLINRGCIPIIAPVGVIQSGKTNYNINADDVSAHIACSLKAEKLVLLTNVSGIIRNTEQGGSLISTLHVSEVETLISHKIIQGGMIPKIKAAMLSLESGVKKVHIIDGRIKHSLLLEIFTDKGIGTEIVRDK